MKRKRATLQDIAEKVGVTKMTISRFLRNPNAVSVTTQQKIKRVIAETGYIPNKAPSLLSNSKSYAIGVLVPSLTNQVFAEVINGIEAITEPTGYQIMMAHYGYSAEVEEKHIKSLLSYQIDGLLLSDFEHTEHTLNMIEQAGIPVVEMMDTTQQGIHDAVGIDTIDAAKMATNTLIRKGYRHPIYFGARLDTRTRLKLDGFTQACQEANLQALSLMTEQSSSFTLGAELFCQALKKYPNIDAIFCTNDDLAVGVIFECQRQGIKIPEQMAIMGFHGHDVGRSIVPKLASVRTPREEIGRRSADILLKRIIDDTIGHSIVQLDVSIDVGESI
ncbi:substrate-binding domain-containing protein [Vibrio artabrorum]|uniref:Substrate-binding domain-containing protein n=1 Tax=Vibrio artabrorum TaxID=446374 RepID=A0ABT8CKK6_9VIBR|nr:substrate-binding domain-containing protein [Vibrio artabrorum]MDN3701880.1 substrate-binding domain-containing protein [Vibrio artabrorum]